MDRVRTAASLVALPLVALTAGPLSAQTLDDVLARHVEGRGGLERIRAVRSVVMTGRMQLNDLDWAEMPIRIQIARPGRIFVRTDLVGEPILQAYDGKRALWRDPNTSSVLPMGEYQAAKVREQADLDGPLIGASEKGYRLNYAGKQTLDGAPVFVVLLAHRDFSRRILLAAESGLPVREVEHRRIGGVEVTTEKRLGDYRTVGGLAFPFRVETTIDGHRNNLLTLEEVELDVPLDESQFSLSSPDLSDFPSPRGLAFRKKAYVDEPLPVFEKSRDLLPEPVVDADPGFVEMYWKCWELAFRHMFKPAPGSPLVSNYLDEAFYPNIFQWDSLFMVMFARYGHHVFPAISTLDNFYARQHRNGFIAREIREKDGTDFYYFLDYMGTDNLVNPPLFGWAELESYRLTGDKSRYEAVIPVLESYAAWLDRYRVRAGTSHGLYWQTSLGSGMDNSPRAGSGWVDMSSQVAMLHRDLAVMLREAGQAARAAEHERKAQEIAARINRFMWSEKDGLYYDVEDDGRQLASKTVASFWPLLAGVASRPQAERLVRNLRDPATFWRTIPFPSLAADQKLYEPLGGYWRGSVWAPTNYMIVKGLERAGYDDFAGEASEAYLRGMYAVFQKTGTVWENYAPDSLSEGGSAKKDFVGWSGCGPIALLIEDVIGLRPDAAAGTVTWHLRRLDRHGVRRLRFGSTTATFLAEARSSPAEKARITVESDGELTLVVSRGGVRSTMRIRAGRQALEL